MIDKHTLQTLEFPKVISLISGKCLTPFGKNEVLEIKPLYDKPAIVRRLKEVSEMKDILNFGDPFPLTRVDDCHEEIIQSDVEGHHLIPEDIIKILQLINLSIELNKYSREEHEKFPSIAEYLTTIRAFPELKKEILRTIDENGDIRDNASQALRKIRSELSETRRRIIGQLDKIISGQKKQAGWQDDVVTIRNDRYVIPVPANNYRSDIGILHDRSQSGATFFIEPQQTVEMNNRIHLLIQEEKYEITRILIALTKEIAIRKEPLLENCRLIGVIDSIHACAQFSNQISGLAPVITNETAEFDFINIRHPLLITQFGSIKKVVPNNLNLNKDRQAILVTGPNTGGKTICLKTIGLSIAMAQSGLHISAEENSSIGLFDKIFADIGDEQSIEQSLSTFSSHIRNIITGIKNASESTLLLFDEIGAGTDPKEGSALAESIIIYTLEKGTRMLVTTHYSQLKTLAMEYPQIENGSFEFNRETLSPTFEIRIGMPGSSYAVEIAGRLGMPDEICKNASDLVGSSEKSVSALIASLEAELLQVKNDKLKLSEQLTNAQELEDYLKTETDKIKNNSEEVLKNSVQDTEKFLEDMRKDIEHLVQDIRSSQASKESLKTFHEKLRHSESEVKKQKKKLSKKTEIDPSTFDVGDSVEIISLGHNGEIEELIGNDRARIRVGNILTTVEIRNLRKTDSAIKSPKKIKTSLYNIQETESNQIHLRGMTADEATEALERFLDRAVIIGFEQVYVIHGKGTGRLRNSLTKYLKGRNEVASLRLGDFNEGGAGVTVVKLYN